VVAAGLGRSLFARVITMWIAGQHLIDVLCAPCEMDEFLAAIGGMRAASGQAAQSTVSSIASHACRADDLCVATGVVWAVRPAVVSISLLPGLDAGSGMMVVRPDGTGIGGPSSR
jgi:hypothetical protein